MGYLLQNRGGVWKVDSASCSTSSITRFAATTDTGDPIAHCRALKNGDLGSSALAEHVFSADHQVDLSKAMVIDTYNHTQTRCMLESWHIQHHQSPLNREKGTLPGLYAALLT